MEKLREIWWPATLPVLFLIYGCAPPTAQDPALAFLKSLKRAWK